MPTALTTPTYTLGSWMGNATDDYGVDWVVEAEDGWSASPPVRTTLEEKKSGDGSWAGPGSYGARVINLVGKAIATDRLSMLAAKERLHAAVGPRSLATLRVDEAHLSRVAQVRLSDQIDIADIGSQAFSWSLTVVAADPRRYDADPSTATTGLPPSYAGLTFPITFPLSFGAVTGSGSGSVTINQRGDYDETPAVLTFVGPVINPSATHVQTGRGLYFALTLNAGESLVVDLGAQTALLNGSASRVFTLTSASAWFMLLPGLNEIQFRGQDPGSGSPPMLSVTASSAWT